MRRARVPPLKLAVDQGRERLYPCLDAASAMASGWFKEAALVRETLEDPRVRSLAEAADDTRRHLRELLEPRILGSVAPDWLRQLPRYLKAEQRRWQRNAVRGSEPANLVQELRHWGTRYRAIGKISSKRSCAGPSSSMSCASGSRNTACRCTRRN